jgi:hypothetical protein
MCRSKSFGPVPFRPRAASPMQPATPQGADQGNVSSSADQSNHVDESEPARTLPGLRGVQSVVTRDANSADVQFQYEKGKEEPERRVAVGGLGE